MHRRTAHIGAFALTLLVCLALLAPSSAIAITRQEVMKRANVWVKLNVPYHQERWATVAGSVIPTSTPGYKTKGYRTDCSGFVSMSYALKTSRGLPLSLDTGSLPSRLVPIAKSQLLPGDVILRPKNLRIDGKLVPSGHVVIFGGWADSTMKTYWGLHEANTKKGTVKEKIAWGTSGYWTSQGFAPYRYRGIRDGIVVPRTFGR